jgi:phage baseplate assembly protein gpV
MLDRLTNAMKSHAVGLDNSSGQAKFGTVSSVNYETGNVRVVIQPDEVLSGWLPMLSQWVGNGWGMICPPNLGDQVLLIPQEGDSEQGIVIGRTYSISQPPPRAPGGEFWLVHKSGSFLKLCNDGVIRIGGDLHVDGDIYDQHGALSHLRASYNGHTHSAQSGGRTTTPSPVD